MLGIFAWTEEWINAFFAITCFFKLVAFIQSKIYSKPFKISLFYWNLKQIVKEHQITSLLISLWKPLFWWIQAVFKNKAVYNLFLEYLPARLKGSFLCKVF